MIPYPNINPEIQKLGPISLRWYGMMYLIGVTASYLLVRFQLKKQEKPAISETTCGHNDSAHSLSLSDIDILYFYFFIGLLLGARVGYVLYISRRAQVLRCFLTDTDR